MELSSLLETLNLSYKNGLFFYDDLNSPTTEFLSIRTKETLKFSLKPSAFFCINSVPLILFFETQTNLVELQRQIWNFNQSPAIFMNTAKGWVIKNGFNLLDNKSDLEEIADSNNLTDFEYFNIITGKTWQDYKSKFEQRNRVDSYLLSNIEDVRYYLINSGHLHPKIVNSLIGRVIFIRYLIDRNVELNVYGITQKEDFYNILNDKDKTYSFFQQVKDDFNGNLFPLKYKIDDEYIVEKERVLSHHLIKIKELLQGGKIYSDGTYQPSLFDIYDFSIIPIEFVSNVYEKFIGVENQADSGAYYTPLFLVDYIQKETVSKFFKKHPEDYNCKVLDPACGSGVFLVETLRQIISRYLALHPVNIENEQEYNYYKEKLKVLLTNNIFGIDKDENAISVAIFSLYITLLDNLKPKSIVGFEFPLLENTNFFTADFFNEEHEFNIELKKQHFEFILGNPPWATKHPEVKQRFEIYIENRRKEEKSDLEIIHREIAESFLVRVSDFEFDETAFIIVSKILYKTEKNGAFRKYFLNKFCVRQVVELSSVRHQIFNQSNDSAVAPATILFFKKENSTETLRKNIVKHISLKPNVFFETFKLMVIEKYDIKEIAQKHFIDEDWIWKVLVYGNILDYYFIKRLKEGYKTIDTVTKSDFLRKRGLQKTKGKENVNVSSLINLPFIDTQKKELKSYFIHSSSCWNKSFVAICPPLETFKSPILLSTKGVDNYFRLKSAISYEDAVFTDSLLAIKAFNNNSIGILQSISAIWNSSFATTFITLTASSIGIEREQVHIAEKLCIPYMTSDTLVDLYIELEKLTKQKYKSLLHDTHIDRCIEDTELKLEKELIKLFDVSNQEQMIMDYVSSITIPMLKGSGRERGKIFKRIEYNDNHLSQYAQIFVNHFGKRFNVEDYYFEVEIIWSEHTILMKFKVIPNPSEEEGNISWNRKGNKEVLKTIAALGFENLSDNLYLQKDIKGFEENFFYIAKPNQYKSWHPALAYLDLNEFVEALHNIDKN